ERERAARGKIPTGGRATVRTGRPSSRGYSEAELPLEPGSEACLAGDEPAEHLLCRVVLDPEEVGADLVERVPLVEVIQPGGVFLRVTTSSRVLVLGPVHLGRPGDHLERLRDQKVPGLEREPVVEDVQPVPWDFAPGRVEPLVPLAQPLAEEAPAPVLDLDRLG